MASSALSANGLTALAAFSGAGPRLRWWRRWPAAVGADVFLVFVIGFCTEAAAAARRRVGTLAAWHRAAATYEGDRTVAIILQTHDAESGCSNTAVHATKLEPFGTPKAHTAPKNEKTHF